VRHAASSGETSLPTTEKYAPKIPGVYIRVFVTSNSKYRGYFSVSVLFADNGKFDAVHNLMQGKSNAIAWAESWLAKKYGGKPTLKLLPS
jgi:hypothetical protein